MSSFAESFESGLLSIVACGLLFGGCASPPGVVFERRSVPIAWPDSKRTPRIEWVGELSSSDDLKPPRSTWDAFGELIAGKKAPAYLRSPRGIYVTPDGQRVWIADPGERCLHLFNLKTRAYRRIVQIDQRPLLNPIGLARGPSGSMFLCDSQSSIVHQLSDADGQLVRSIELTTDFQRPVGLAYDAESDEIFVADVAAHDIKVIRPGGELVRVLGRRGAAPGEFNFPSSIALNNQRLWIADAGNHRIQAISKTGEPILQFGQAGDSPGDLALPKAIALDADGHLYVIDSRFENVQVFDDGGRLLIFFGQEGRGPGEFWLPGGIFIDDQARIWVADAYNRRVQVFQYIRGMDHVE